MKTFEDIEAIWHVAETISLPDAGEILKKAKRSNNRLANKILLQSACLMLSVFAMAFVLHEIKFQYRSSYIGISLMFIVVILFAAIRFRQSLFLKKADFSQSPASLLHQFESFHKKQIWINTYGIVIYSIMINIAFAFYFYETLWRAMFTIEWKILIIAVYIAWMCVAIFYLGKKNIRREHNRTNDIIQKLKQLQEAFG